MKDNAILALGAALLLGGYIFLPWSDPTLRSVAVGALVGLVGGHLNGSRSGSSADRAPPG